MTSSPFWEFRRRWRNNFARLALFGLSVLAALPFGWILWYVIEQGFGALSWSLVTELPKGPGSPGGGIANAILGSFIMVILASLIGLPWGIAVGIYLSEFGRGKTATVLRFRHRSSDQRAVDYRGHFHLRSGRDSHGFFRDRRGFSFGDHHASNRRTWHRGNLKLMPMHIREAGLALGLPRWKVIMKLVVPGSRPALITAVMLAIARVFGETAPLLFTALGNQFFSRTLAGPTASMPVQIYNLARSGFVDLEKQAWAGALLLVFFVVLVNLVTRWMLPRAASSK